MILQGYDAIVLNAASPTALNGAVKEACDAGIIGRLLRRHRHRALRLADRRRLQEDGRRPDRLSRRAPARWRQSARNPRPCRRLRRRRDLVPASIEGVEAHPQFKIVGSVHGDWAQAVAQKAVAGILPSLPEVVGVVTQGGDGYGAAQAFEAAGRPMPIIIMGNRHDELTWWKEQKDANGYETMSRLDRAGRLHPRLLGRPAGPRRRRRAEGSDRAVPADRPGRAREGLEMTPEGGVTNEEYTQDEAKEIIAGGKSKPSGVVRLLQRGGPRPIFRPASSSGRRRSVMSSVHSHVLVRCESPIVALRGVAKSFGAVRALAGVDLVVRPGECLGLVGHNGAGKSTLMQILAGTLSHDEGELVLSGSREAASGGSVSDAHSRRHSLRLPGTVALPEPDRRRECPAAACRDLGLRLAEARGLAHRRAARRDLPPPRHPAGRRRRRPVDRPPPDGRDRRELHRDRRPRRASSSSTSRRRRWTSRSPSSSSPMSAASSPMAAASSSSPTS